MDNPFESPVILSFCPGILGLERGLERAIGKFTVAAYCEIEAFICANLVAGMEAGILAPAPIWSDVKTFPSQFFRGKIHGIIGGYPCQPFSNAGNRRGEDDPRHLWPNIERHIDAIRPIWCFFENVSGHLSLGYDHVYKSLRDLGYSIEAGIYTAEETGAPHERERIFILALDHSRCHGLKPEYAIPAGRHSTQLTSKMADTRYNRQGKQQHQSKKQQKEFTEKFSTGTALANPGGSERRSNDSDGCGPNENNLSERSKEAIGPTQCSEVMANTKGSGERGGAGDFPEKDGRPDSGMPFQPSGAGSELANRNSEGLAQWPEQSAWQEFPSLERSGNPDRWPANPGEPQHDWEEPRTLECPLGRSAPRNTDGFDILYLKNVYAIYTANKTSAIEELCSLWNRIEQEAHKWTIGRLHEFLKKEILFTHLHGKIQNNRLACAINGDKAIQVQEKNGVFVLWNSETIVCSPQGQEYIKQLRFEFADAMCILSYQITLAGRQEAFESSYDKALQRLRNNYQDAWWDVPETLSKISEIWRSFSDKHSWWRQIEFAYKGYCLELTGQVFGYHFREDLLRALGNSVVEQTAEIAFNDLFKKHLAQ